MRGWGGHFGSSLVSATKQSYFQADNRTGRVRIDTVHINYKFNYSGQNLCCSSKDVSYTVEVQVYKIQ